MVYAENQWFTIKQCSAGVVWRCSADLVLLDGMRRHLSAAGLQAFVSQGLKAHLVTVERGCLQSDQAAFNARTSSDSVTHQRLYYLYVARAQDDNLSSSKDIQLYVSLIPTIYGIKINKIYKYKWKP